MLTGSALEPPVTLLESLRQHFQPALLELRGQQGAYWLERALEERLRADFFAAPGRLEQWQEVTRRVSQADHPRGRFGPTIRGKLTPGGFETRDPYEITPSLVESAVAGRNLPIRCGQGSLYETFLQVRKTCLGCGVTFQPYAGDSLGVYAICYGLSVVPAIAAAILVGFLPQQ